MSLIGVFDSGIGGLTVLKRLAQAYPHLDFIYLADTARLPYGTKSSQTISEYLKRNVDFLIQKEVELIVVACNSASTVLLNSHFKFPIPVLNVIEPGAQNAIEVSESHRIGVLGTRTTVLSQAYVKTLRKHSDKVQVFQMAAPLLVPLVEEGWVDDPLTSMVVFRYTKPLLDQKIDTLILGCTHYPVLNPIFRKVVGGQMPLVDSPESLIKKLNQDFSHLSVSQDSSSEPSSHKGLIRIYCTDLTPHLEQLIHYMIAPLPMQPIQKTDL